MAHGIYSNWMTVEIISTRKAKTRARDGKHNKQRQGVNIRIGIGNMGME